MQQAAVYCLFAVLPELLVSSVWFIVVDVGSS